MPGCINLLLHYNYILVSTVPILFNDLYGIFISLVHYVHIQLFPSSLVARGLFAGHSVANINT